MNSFNLVGRLVKDPEVKIFGEKKVTSFRMAVKRKFGEKSDFFTCNYWNDNYISQYAQKGTIVSLTGEVHINEKDGYFVTVVVDHARILSDGKPKNAGAENQSFESCESFESFEDYEEISDAEMQGLFEKK